MAIEKFTKENVNEHVKANRQREYIALDGLFFKAQRNEIAIAVWEDAVAQVKLKFPYVTADVEIEV